MKRHIPNRVELSVFIAMAVISTLIVALSPQRDVALAFCTAPIFLIAALLGFRRSELGRVRGPVKDVNDLTVLAE